MPIVLALLTATFFGVGDFTGGLATRRSRIVPVIAGAHVVGLAGIGVVTAFVAETFTIRDFLLGVGAGGLGGVGIFFLYRRLAIGPMAVVAPLTAVTSAVVPVTADLTRGGSFSTLTWIGMAAAVAAIGIVSAADDGGSGRPVTASVVLESLLAGIGFGSFFIVLDATDAASAPWPIVGSRLCTVAVLVLVLLLGPASARVRPDRATASLIVLTGVFDTGSNTLFLYATLEGDLAVVAVLSSLYPVVTAWLARLVFDERLGTVQMSGAGLAVVATMLIAAG